MVMWLVASNAQPLPEMRVYAVDIISPPPQLEGEPNPGGGGVPEPVEEPEQGPGEEDPQQGPSDDEPVEDEEPEDDEPEEDEPEEDPEEEPGQDPGIVPLPPDPSGPGDD